MYFQKQQPIKILAKDAIYADMLALSINSALGLLSTCVSNLRPVPFTIEVFLSINLGLFGKLGLPLYIRSSNIFQIIESIVIEANYEK